MTYSASDSRLPNAEVYRRARADVRRSQAGMMSGWSGIVFGVLGVFTFGVLFVPVAALFSLTSIFRSSLSRNPCGLVIGLVGLLLAVVGFVVSPTMWIAVVAGLAFLFGHADSTLVWANFSGS